MALLISILTLLTTAFLLIDQLVSPSLFFSSAQGRDTKKILAVLEGGLKKNPTSFFKGNYV